MFKKISFAIAIVALLAVSSYSWAASTAKNPCCKPLNASCCPSKLCCIPK